MNTIAYAVLGLLARRSASGYEVSAHMQDPIGYFWTASHGQVHTTLAMLVEAGLVTFTTEHGPGPHDKKVYRITAAGRAELAGWVSTPAAAPQPRNELLLKMFSSWAAPPGEVAGMLTAEIDRRERLRERLRTLLARFEADGPPADVAAPRFADYATLRQGIALEGEYLDWLRWLADAFAGRHGDHGAP